MVSLAPSHLTPAELHDRAHRAAFGARDENDWWNGSLDTGLAAAAGAIHTPGNRQMGERALDALLQWFANGHSRGIGEDAAALALGALAAKQLRGGNKKLSEAAVRTLETVLNSERAEIAPLHLTLAAWALGQIHPPDENSPWPELTHRLRSSPTGGVNGPLVTYGLALSSGDPDPHQLARELVSAQSVDASENSVLLWVVWSATTRLTALLPEDDADLQVLRRRRAEIFETVAAEIDFGDFDRSIEDDFDPFAEVPPQTEFADVFEMLMIDLALSSEITGEPFQTPTEVRVIKQRASQRGLLFAAITVEIAAFLGSALATVLALWAGARAPIVVGIAAMALSAGSLVALRVWDQAGSTRWPRGALAVAEAATFLFGLALIINWWEQKPLLRPDVFWPTAVGLAGAFWLVPLFFSVLVVLGFRRSTCS